MIDRDIWNTLETPKILNQPEIAFHSTRNRVRRLITSSGKKTSTILQLLKETGIRIGESLRLEWTALDSEHNMLTLNDTIDRHRNMQNTLTCTQLVEFEIDDYRAATATTTDEAKQLLESGFEYFCTTPENIMLFRKRK